MPAVPFKWLALAMAAIVLIETSLLYVSHFPSQCPSLVQNTVLVTNDASSLDSKVMEQSEIIRKLEERLAKSTAEHIDIDRINPMQNASSASNADEFRVVVSMSATPKEILNGLNGTINWILSEEQTYKVDAFYLQIPYMQIRDGNKLYPSTKVLESYFPQNKVVIHRLFVDAGPMSRYLGVMELETDPETLIISFDVDIESKKRTDDFIEKFVRMSKYDGNVWWNMQSETPIYSQSKQTITRIAWGLWPVIYDDEHGVAWERRTVFRAVSGVGYRRRFLDDVWMNATEYHEGCFWDDDHWLSFNMERKGILVKRIVEYENDHQRRRTGSLSKINTKLNSKKMCTAAIMRRHPDIWIEAREQ